MMSIPLILTCCIQSSKFIFNAHFCSLIGSVARVAALAHFSHHFAQMDNVVNKSESNAKLNGNFCFGFNEHALVGQ